MPRKLKSTDRLESIYDAVVKSGSVAAPPTAMSDDQKFDTAIDLLSSLKKFSQYIWPIAEPGVKFVGGWHVDCIAEHLQEWCNPEGDIQNLAICIPPRFGKSFWCCVAVFCYRWAIDPSSRWMFSSHSDHLVRRDSTTCRSIVKSQRFRDLFPHVEISPETDTTMYFKSTMNGFRYGTTVQGQGIGEGANYLIADDPMSLRMSRSKLGQETVWSWWGSVMSQRVRDPKTTRRLVDMQRLSQGDLVGKLKSEVPDDWVFLDLPMEYEPRRMVLPILNDSLVRAIAQKEPVCHRKDVAWSATEDRDVIKPTPLQRRRWDLLDWPLGSRRGSDGDLLWPQRFGRKEVDQAKRALGPDAAGQHAQRPTANRGDLFDQDTFRRYTVEKTSEGFAVAVLLENDDGQIRRVPMDAITFFQTIDTATTAKQLSAYTVIGTFGAVNPAMGGGLIVWDIFRAKVPQRHQFNLVRSLRTHRCMWLELNQSSQRLSPWPFTIAVQAIEKASSGYLLHELGVAASNPLHLLAADRDKISRAMPIMTMYADGQVYHPAHGSAPWVSELETELLLFPNGTYKDQVDVVSYAGIMVTREQIIVALINRPYEATGDYQAVTGWDDRDEMIRRILDEDSIQDFDRGFRR